MQWLAGGWTALHLPFRGMRFNHVPARRVTIEVAEFAGEPITLACYGPAGQLIGSAAAPAPDNNVHQLEVSGEGIVSLRISGGGGEGLLVSYCIEPMAGQPELHAPQLFQRNGAAAGR